MRTRFLALSLLLVAGPALAAGKAKPASVAPKLVTIGEIDGESDAKMTIVNVRLDHSLTGPQTFEMQDHGSFLQMNLPNAIVPEPGKFFEGSNPYLPKIAVFQVGPSEAGVRFFASKNTAKIKQALSAEALGNRIMVTIDNAKLEGLLAATPVNMELVGPPSEFAAKATTAESVIAMTQVSKDIPEPAILFKGDAKAAQEVQIGQGNLDLRGKLIKVSIFSAALLAFLGLTWLFKPYLRRKAAAKGFVTEAAITMKSLATLPMGARQKIQLIQVGNQQILIGVGPDNVTFLTTIVGGNSPMNAMASHVAPPIPVPTMAQQQSFSRMLSERSDSLEMRAAPVLKNIPGNDPETLSTSVKDEMPAAAPKARLSGGRINVSVGEDGIKQHASPKKSKAVVKDEGEGQKAIDDVTRMIREKLKTLRTI